MADISTFLEYVGEDGRSPSNLHINLGAQSSTRSWLWTPQTGGAAISAPDLQQITQTIVGTTQYDVSATAGRLTRTLPLADPLMPWLYASDISAMRGLGGDFTEEQPQLNTNDATFPGWANFPLYEFTVECTARPYPVSPDSSITSNQVTWTQIDSSNAGPITYYPEWLRFCDWDFAPIDEYVSQQRGGAYFQTSDNSEPGDASNPATLQQQPRMYLPNQLFKIRWFGVPARYILSTNSYLNKFRGMVNQKGWNGPLGPVGTSIFPPGCLLYVGYRPMRFYTPVYPVTTNLFGSFISYDRLVDLEVMFLHTTRKITKAPTPGNTNYVAGGWNAQPYLPKRLYYYTYCQDKAGNKNPMFYSFPVELLWTDPDAPGAYQGNG